METLKNKLKSFRKNLSTQHLSRDIMGFQYLIVSIIIASLIFNGIVTAATGATNPEQVMETAQKTTRNIIWFFFISLNVMVFVIGGKAEMYAKKDEEYILTNYGGKQE